MTAGGTRAREVLLGALASACALGLAGCSPDADGGEPWDLGPFDTLIDNAIDEAREGGASEQQLAVLLEAREDGELTYEAMRSAALALESCFALHGGTMQIEEAIDVTGMPQLTYLVGFDEDLGETFIENAVAGCERQEYKWVTFVYQLQPKARELLGQYVLKQEPVLRACLEASGVSTDPADDGWDLAYRALDVASETANRVDCLSAADIAGL